MSSEGSVLIPINRKRTAGSKYFIREENLKNNHAGASNPNHVIKYIRVLKPGSIVNTQSLNLPKRLPNNKDDNKNLTKNNHGIQKIYSNETDVVKHNGKLPEIKVNALISSDRNENNLYSIKNDLIKHNEEEISEIKNTTVKSSYENNYQKLSINKKNINKQSTELSDVKLNLAVPPSGNNNSHKRKRRRRNLNKKLHDCFEPEIYPNCFNSTVVDGEMRVSSVSPNSTGSGTQSIFQYKNHQDRNTDKNIPQPVLPFTLSNDSSFTSLVRVTLNSIVGNSKIKNVSSKYKNETIISDNSSENTRANNTILVSSTCSTKNVINLEPNIPVVKPCENTITISESNKSSCRENNSLCDYTKNTINGETHIPVEKPYEDTITVSKDDNKSFGENNFLNDKKTTRLKNITGGQSFPLKIYNSMPKITALKSKTTQASLPASSYISLDKSEVESHSKLNDPNSTSLLENYCTAIEFTYEEGVPIPCLKDISCVDKVLSNSEERSDYEEIQYLGSNCKKLENNLHSSIKKSASLNTPSQKIIYEESDSYFEGHQNVLNSNIKEAAKCFRTLVKNSNNIDSVQDNDTTLIKQQNVPLQQVDLNEDKDREENVSNVTFHPVTSSTHIFSSQSSDTSSHVEYLNEESKICLGRIVKMMAKHYKVPSKKCIFFLESNSFNVLSTLLELQLSSRNISSSDE